MRSEKPGVLLLVGVLLVAPLVFAACGSSTVSRISPTNSPTNSPTIIENDGATISIPAGAVDSGLQIHVEEVEAPLPPDEGHEPGGPVFAFTPHGTQFNAAVTITIPFDEAPDHEELGVFRLGTDDDTNWISAPGATFGDDHLATFQTDSFSYYTVMVIVALEDGDPT